MWMLPMRCIMSEHGVSCILCPSERGMGELPHQAGRAEVTCSPGVRQGWPNWGSCGGEAGSGLNWLGAGSAAAAHRGRSWPCLRRACTLVAIFGPLIMPVSLSLAIHSCQGQGDRYSSAAFPRAPCSSCPRPHLEQMPHSVSS